MERFWIVLGDIHERTAMLAKIPDLEQAEAVILSGDLTNLGGKEAAERVVNLFARRSPRVLAQVGNMDTVQVETVLEASQRNIHRRVLELAPDVGLAAVGYSTPTPFGTPSEVDEATMARWADEVLAQAGAKFRHVLFVAHTPPWNTVVDRLPSGVSVGSPGVRQAIAIYQPEVVVVGHIHEARGEDWIGKSHILNPGDFGRGGYVRVVYTPQGLEGRLEYAGGQL